MSWFLFMLTWINGLCSSLFERLNWCTWFGKCANWEILLLLMLLSDFKITKQKSLIIAIWCALTHNRRCRPVRLSLYLNNTFVNIILYYTTLYYIFKFDGIRNERKNLSFLQSRCLHRMAQKFICMLYVVFCCHHGRCRRQVEDSVW